MKLCNGGESGKVRGYDASNSDQEGQGYQVRRVALPFHLLWCQPKTFGICLTYEYDMYQPGAYKTRHLQKKEFLIAPPSYGTCAFHFNAIGVQRFLPYQMLFPTKLEIFHSEERRRLANSAVI